MYVYIYIYIEQSTLRMNAFIIEASNVYKLTLFIRI
jgi:hypothetical protein